MQAIEKATGKPVVNYVETTFPLSDGGPDLRGAFEPAGLMGNSLTDFLNVEGSYTLCARATYGGGRLGAREMKWSIHVDVGIDPGKTTVSVTPVPPGPDGNPNSRRLLLAPAGYFAGQRRVGRNFGEVRYEETDFDEDEPLLNASKQNHEAPTTSRGGQVHEPR